MLLHDKLGKYLQVQSYSCYDEHVKKETWRWWILEEINEKHFTGIIESLIGNFRMDQIDFTSLTTFDTKNRTLWNSTKIFWMRLNTYRGFRWIFQFSFWFQNKHAIEFSVASVANVWNFLKNRLNLCVPDWSIPFDFLLTKKKPNKRK